MSIGLTIIVAGAIFHSMWFLVGRAVRWSPKGKKFLEQPAAEVWRCLAAGQVVVWFLILWIIWPEFAAIDRWFWSGLGVGSAVVILAIIPHSISTIRPFRSHVMTSYPDLSPVGTAGRGLITCFAIAGCLVGLAPATLIVVQGWAIQDKGASSLPMEFLKAQDVLQTSLLCLSAMVVVAVTSAEYLRRGIAAVVSAETKNLSPQSKQLSPGSAPAGDRYFAPEYTLMYACYLTALLGAIYLPVAASAQRIGKAIAEEQLGQLERATTTPATQPSTTPSATQPSISSSHMTVVEGLKARKELEELLGVSGANALQTAIGLVIPIASGVIAAATGKRESKSKEGE